MEVIVSINNKDLAGINHLPAEFSRGVEKGMREAIIFAESKSKQDFTKSRSAAGGLHVRSGTLRRSIQSGISKSGNTITAYLGSSVIYSAIHELGGVIKPKGGNKWLRFPIQGQWVSVKEVVIPARPYLQPAITENLERISNIIISNIVEEVNK